MSIKRIWKEYKVAYVYIAPFFILFAIFGLFPIAYGFYLSFFRWDGLSAMHFVAFTNYINICRDPLFWKALYNTLLIGIIAHIPILLGGLTLAFVLNAKLVRGKNLFKTVYFMPMVTSSVAISIVFQQMFGNNYGVINWFVSLLGGEKVNWLGGDGSLIKVAVICMFAWKWTGWNMVIYLAGMQGISGDIYEAAQIDGAGQAQIFFRICIRLLKPIIIFTVIQSTIGMFN
ncbi:carbohydrate ABC transporter permease [Lachnoclostridium sp. Marseille-P6806]|uniref:carbohydrate ABC transporter permease n=1 Tax=Lachnoclostridium sp. Marseille-P6806 TaxID=2364793 RepID=UPI0010314151|nr:sugar ABC transporter permease [Lachnoclostridium sp. Marseille-P6806]